MEQAEGSESPESYELLTGIYSQTNQTLNLMEHGLGVRIENFNMPFGAMVGLMVKIAVASIPAAIIFMILVFLMSCVVLTTFAGTISGLLGT